MVNVTIVVVDVERRNGGDAAVVCKFETECSERLTRDPEIVPESKEPGYRTIRTEFFQHKPVSHAFILFSGRHPEKEQQHISHKQRGRKTQTITKQRLVWLDWT